MKKLLSTVIGLCLVYTLTTRALADYTIEPPAGPDYGDPTSVETVYTADRGEQPNEYKGKDAVMIPPAFGVGGIYPLNAFSDLLPYPPVRGIINTYINTLLLKGGR